MSSGARSAPELRPASGSRGPASDPQEIRKCQPLKTEPGNLRKCLEPLTRWNNFLNQCQGCTYNLRRRTTQQLPQAQGRPRSPVRASLLHSSRPRLPRAQSVRKASAHQLHLIIAQSVKRSFRPTPNSPGPTRRCSWMLNIHAIPQVRAIYETVVYFSRFETNCDCDSFGFPGFRRQTFATSPGS